jgi:hypothetical protein
MKRMRTRKTDNRHRAARIMIILIMIVISLIIKQET